MSEKRKALNSEIRATKVQVIQDWVGNLWEMQLHEALEKAKEQGLDVMEIGKNWDATIVKIIDYGKFLYKQKKQDQKNKQRSKAPELKTLRITFKIGEHDLEVRKHQAEWFAKDGDNLKVDLMLRWRENQYVEIAKEKMRHFVQMLSEVYKVDKPIIVQWNHIVVTFKPVVK
jgi:translation initiation factor IF-3